MKGWAASELQFADLGDVRRNKRLVRLVEDLAAQPNASVPQASGDLAATQAAYDFWSSPHIKAEAIRQAHQSSTIERVKQHSIVIAIQDTTELNFSHHPSKKGTVEENPPPGVKPVSWLLLTTLPVICFEDVVQVLRWYSYRWLIERYHYVLKSGCRLEQLQLETGERIQRALATYTIVAWRLLWITYLARYHPQTPADTILATHEWQALYCTIHKTPQPAVSPPNLNTCVRWIAQLGGFLGRKGDGEPGVKTIWQGLRRLHDIAQIWLLVSPTSTVAVKSSFVKKDATNA